jgi:3-deoxy-D-manno-octulosonic-acid transferase
MMNRIAFGVYQLSVTTYVALIYLFSLWHPKARLMIAGRKNWRKELQNQLHSLNKELVWVHCASLGEFEMARPIIEHLRRQNQYSILITFFSPSGYIVRKNYSGADIVAYLPFDIGNTAMDFVAMTKPAKTFFVKYELWLGYLRALKKHNINHYLIGALFKPNGIYFKQFGNVYRDALESFTYIFTQTEQDLELLRKHNILNAMCAGDPRYDRVWQNAQIKKENNIVLQFIGARICLVLGSSYEYEEKIVADALPLLPNNICIVIAPHEVNETRIAEIERRFKNHHTIRYSQWHKSTIEQTVLIIDNVGMLADIYQYATASFVGGGFGSKGIHNILEPLAMGSYVFVGPKNHNRFPEVTHAVNAKVASIIKSPDMLITELQQLISEINTSTYNKEQTTRFISEKTGASSKIIHKTAI